MTGAPYFRVGLGLRMREDENHRQHLTCARVTTNLFILHRAFNAASISLLKNYDWLYQPMARHSREGGNPVILKNNDHGSQSDSD